MPSKKYLIIILIVFLILSLISTVYLVLQTTVISKKATTNNTSPITIENSYLFASPLQAKADNMELIRITVFLLDGRGIGVAQQPVKLLLPSTAIKTTNLQATTDDSGKAVFDLSSSLSGQFEISAQTGNKTIPQKVKITFY